MIERRNAPSTGIVMQAEREMSAFMKAVTDVVGQSDLWGAGEIWLHAMETLDWPDEDHEKFFHRVSVLAINLVLAGSQPESAGQIRGYMRRLTWLPFSRSAI